MTTNKLKLVRMADGSFKIQEHKKVAKDGPSECEIPELVLNLLDYPDEAKCFVVVQKSSSQAIFFVGSRYEVASFRTGETGFWPYQKRASEGYNNLSLREVMETRWLSSKLFDEEEKEGLWKLFEATHTTEEIEEFWFCAKMVK